MKTFTIDQDNNITVHPSKQAARATGLGIFSTPEQFSDLIGPDAKRLVEIWNSITGVNPVKKFKDRKTATERIWKAIQTLGESVQPEAAEAGTGDQPEAGDVVALAEEAHTQPAADIERTVEEPATVAPEAPQGPDTA